MRMAVSKNKGDRKTIPSKEAMISNARLTIWYVLRTKLTTMPKMPLPNNIIVDGSGARDLGFSVWSGMAVTAGYRVSCCAETFVSCGMISDNAAHAVVTKKTLAAIITVAMATLKIFSSMGYMFFIGFIRII